MLFSISRVVKFVDRIVLHFPSLISADKPQDAALRNMSPRLCQSGSPGYHQGPRFSHYEITKPLGNTDVCAYCKASLQGSV